LAGKGGGTLNGPTATGQHCPEGWTFYAEPLPQLGNVTSPGSGEGSYYTWVDQFNTLGLGENVPINTGNQSEGLLIAMIAATASATKMAKYTTNITTIHSLKPRTSRLRAVCLKRLHEETTLRRMKDGSNS
jgi:hypothetical protein